MYGECLLYIKLLLVIVIIRVEFKREDILFIIIKIYVYVFLIIVCLLYIISSFIRIIFIIIFVIVNIFWVNIWVIGVFEFKFWICWSSWIWCSWRRSCWDWFIVRLIELCYG